VNPDETLATLLLTPEGRSDPYGHSRQDILQAYFTELLAERRRLPAADLLSPPSSFRARPIGTRSGSPAPAWRPGLTFRGLSALPTRLTPV
jgi:hypothetical protein